MTRAPRQLRAFTLIELMVVMGVIVLLVTLAVPAVRAMSQSNARIQAVNQIRAYLSQARGIAIGQHRQAGVVFFEETDSYAKPHHAGRIAMQIFVEHYDQRLFNPAPGNTIFVHYSTAREYLSPGIKLATLNDVAKHQTVTGRDDSPNVTRGITRAVVFDADGNMITRHGLARPDLGGAGPGTYPRAYGDWWFTTKGGAPDKGISSPGLFVFDDNELKTQGIPTGTNGDARRDEWIKNNSDVILINSHTGTFLQ